MMRLVYSKHYNIGLFGLERLHPFDSRKYGRAWTVLRRRFGRQLDANWIRPRRPAATDQLRLIHTAEYLSSLRKPDNVADALELPPLRRAPAWLLDWCVLRPMRWAVQGSIIGAEAALDDGLAVNLSGGYHHASPDRGEGFCIYADVAIAIAALRNTQRLADTDRIAYIDLDAHQGNGVCHAFRDDACVFIFDMYNPSIYPWHDLAAKDRIDCDLPLPDGCSSSEYLDLLKQRLPGFIDSISSSAPVKLAVYNAGTDIVCDDPLGALNISPEAILKRDLLVVEELRRRGIPTLMVLSGGYTRSSYELVADSVTELAHRFFFDE